MEKGYVKLLLTSSVCAAIIAGVFSLVTVQSTNQITKEIEAMKYEYSLHQETYKELKDAINYFARVKVFSRDFINHFEYSEDGRSFDSVFEMAVIANDEFKARARCISPYLSAEANEILEKNGVFEFKLNTYKIDISKVSDIESANEECRLLFNSINNEYEKFSEKIIEAIEYDIKSKYIPK